MSCGSCGSCASTASYGARRGADIIDLDRYMRQAVKPHRDRRVNVHEQFIVDAGGVDRAPRPLSDSGDSSVPARTHLHPLHASHPDRYSLDSGVSDGSYVRRRQKLHRRPPEERGLERGEAGAAGAAASSSAAQFRLACEKALREQQEQIARVAQLCERLAQPAPAPPQPAVAVSSDSSVTSSSRSQPRRRDKRRSESCRTYDIIMTKLDELSRLFAARRSPSPSPRRARPPSSGSVSVCDKIVATEPSAARTVVVGRACVTQGTRVTQRARVSEGTHVIEGTGVTQGCVTEGTGLMEGTFDDAPAGDTGTLHSGDAASPQFDLADPIHLYEQAKRLQALHVSARCASAGRPPRVERLQRCEDTPCIGGDDRTSLDGAGRSADERVCAACRFYWRVVCRTLAQLFAPRTAA